MQAAHPFNCDESASSGTFGKIELKEIANVKRITRYLAILLLLLGIPLAARAQSFDVALGFGTNHDKSNGQGTDTISGSSCTPSSEDTTCDANPSLNNF